LILLVKCCRALLRDTDLVGRLGGEEFALLLPDATADAAFQVAERVRLNLADLEIAAEGAAFSFTVSIGVACCEPVETSVEQTIGRADRALYRAKSEGRDRTLAAC
jgi:two-component system, cell cycle response regulator